MFCLCCTILVLGGDLNAQTTVAATIKLTTIEDHITTEEDDNIQTTQGFCALILLNSGHVDCILILGSHVFVPKKSA